MVDHIGQLNNLRSPMFKIFMVSDNEFIVTGIDQPFTGTRIKTIAFLLNMGVSENEIHYGLSQMIDNGHHIADYGIHRMLTYTSKVA